MDGKIVGLCGLALKHGRWIAFCELSDEVRRHKRAIIRAGREVIAEARRAGHRFVYAKVDGNVPITRRWLASLGFQPESKTGLYRWQA